MAMGSKSGRLRRGLRVCVPVIIIAFASLSLTAWTQSPTGGPGAASTSPSNASTQSAQQDKNATKSASVPVLPRGKKLMLKDGDLQVVREYKVEGDRVRYYSMESHQWEEMPASLVDWDATRKMEAEAAKADAATVARVHAREEANKGPQLDIDASLEAAPNVFIPQGEGAYVFDGNAVVPLVQAVTDVKGDKGRTFKQVLVPIPIIPSRRHISIPGVHSKLRITTSQPEFYIRTADGHEPEMQLIQTKTKGYSRFVENIDTLFKQDTAMAETLPMQRWIIANGVFRFTLGQPIPPGEYVLAELVQTDGISVYVWDFGVDGNGKAAAAKSK
jgi:hypothetical protein